MLTLCKGHSIKISGGHVLHPTLVATVHWDLSGIPVHPPDLRGLRQSLRALLVSRYPTQAASGTQIHWHWKQAPVDTVTVHTCEAHDSTVPPKPGNLLPGPLAVPSHTSHAIH